MENGVKICNCKFCWRKFDVASTLMFLKVYLPRERSSQVDAHPFKHWYESHYGVVIGIKKGKKAPPKEETEVSTNVYNVDRCHAEGAQSSPSVGFSSCWLSSFGRVGDALVRNKVDIDEHQSRS